MSKIKNYAADMCGEDWAEQLEDAEQKEGSNMAETKEALSLPAKIAKIAAELGPISKSGVNAQQHYKFIENGSVTAKVRDLQDKYGVAVIPAVEEYICDEVRGKEGKIGFHYIVKMLFRVIDTDNPEATYEARWLGEATDFGDKGINKAETSATKYFYMKLYNISEKGEDDPDKDTPDPIEDLKQQAPKTSRIDFSEVRKTLAEIETVEDLEEYWRSLGALSDNQSKFLQRDFAKRKGEINGAN